MLCIIIRLVMTTRYSQKTYKLLAHMFNVLTMELYFLLLKIPTRYLCMMPNKHTCCYYLLFFLKLLLDPFLNFFNQAPSCKFFDYSIVILSI